MNMYGFRSGLFGLMGVSVLIAGLSILEFFEGLGYPVILLMVTFFFFGLSVRDAVKFFRSM